MDNLETEPMDLNGAASAITDLMDDTTETEEVEAVETDETQEIEATDEAEDEIDTEPKFKVKVNGEERLVSQADLIKGHMLHEDYTRKTTELAQERQRIRAEESQAYTQQLQQMKAVLTAAVGQDQQIDWAKLANEDPAEYVRQQHAAQERQRALNLLTQRQAEEAERNLAETLTREQSKLLERRPEWKDDSKRGEDFAAMRGYLAKDYGFSEQEINSLTDHRHMDIAWKASQYDKLQASKPQVTKKVEKLPVRHERPGVASDGRGTKSTMDKLRRSGRVEDAAAHIASLLR
jgi:hypothetical protein